MKTIVDYTLVDVSIGTYRNVKELISEGWQPFGSPVSAHWGRIYQVFVKYETIN